MRKYREHDKKVLIILHDKKVLLRERKRHTARRVVSTPSVVLTGYPPGRVPPILTWSGGYPVGGTLPGYPPSWPGGYPGRVPPGRVPPSRVPLTGYPPAGYPPAGYPLAGPGWVPPLGVCPMEFWVML